MENCEIGWQELYLQNSKGEYYKTHTKEGVIITTTSLSDALIFVDEDEMMGFYINMKHWYKDADEKLKDFVLYTYPQGEKYA